MSTVAALGGPPGFPGQEDAFGFFLNANRLYAAKGMRIDPDTLFIRSSDATDGSQLLLSGAPRLFGKFCYEARRNWNSGDGTIAQPQTLTYPVGLFLKESGIFE